MRTLVPLDAVGRAVSGEESGAFIRPTPWILMEMTEGVRTEGRTAAVGDRHQIKTSQGACRRQSSGHNRLISVGQAGPGAHR
jgi:hypothetical protein